MLSVVVPVYNESRGITGFHEALMAVLEKLDESCEVIYCNDGSTDNSRELLTEFCETDKRIKLLSLTRNFGKEIATTAGIHAATGEAIITLDGDGQHPVELIPEFLAKWRKGDKVVIGVRTANQSEGLVKRIGSKLFYRAFNQFTGLKLIPGSSDFRLIDRVVQQEFGRMTERNRMTRVLIDWTGYQREFIYFQAKARTTGTAPYSFQKLFRLAIDSIISHSTSPLYVSAYIGGIVLPLSVLLGLVMFVNLLLNDPMHLHATGSAYLMVFVLFLVGILLVSQGIIGLYLSHIHTETQNRPLYLVDTANSKGLHAE